MLSVLVNHPCWGDNELTMVYYILYIYIITCRCIYTYIYTPSKVCINVYIYTYIHIHICLKWVMRETGDGLYHTSKL